MNNVARRLLVLLSVATLLTSFVTWPVNALSSVERDLVRSNAPWWFASQSICGSIAANTGPTMNGHTLPAAQGGTGFEAPLNPEGRIIKNDGSLGNHVAFAGSIPQDERLSELYRDYYITMRWNYVSWNWDGTSGGDGTETKDYYQTAPRVLVTNPETKKSIIAVILEAGPAPWTGVLAPPPSVMSSSDLLHAWVNDPSRKPSYWQTPQIGTPAGYNGRVSGFPPKAIKELGATQRMLNGAGVNLIYAWAPDQSADPGPTPLTADASQAGTPSAACQSLFSLGGNLRRDTSALHCTVGEEITEVQVGYANANPIPTRICRVQSISVNVLISQPVNELVKAARAEGISLSGGGFRTIQEQRNTRVANGCVEGPECLKPPSQGFCVTATACPGWSNHQMGLAIDFSYNGDLITSRSNPGFVWLSQNAKRFGLKNLPIEPWHWSVDGG